MSEKRELVRYVMTEHQVTNAAGAGLSVSIDGRRFGLFNVVDGFNREARAIEVDLDISAHRVSAERG